MLTYYLRSFGCQMNDHDAERIRAVLEAESYRPVERPDEARVIVFNTCTVRRSADERFFGHLGEASRLKKEDPDRLVIVCGCLPQAEGAGFLDEHPFVDATVGPQNLHLLGEVVRGGGGGVSLLDDTPVFSGDLPSVRTRPFQAWVQVMSGCSNHCSYCIVPAVRGPERSRPVDDVVSEVETLVGDGVLEITLLGQNVNSYGRDLSNDPRRATFAGLLRSLDGIDGLRRIRFTTSHPRDLSDDLIAAMADAEAVCEHLHLPAQSGSDRTLAAMRRGYTIEEYVRRLDAVRDAVPEIAITTDLMVGFPGESEADFEATLDLVRRARFDASFTFVFSPRPGTDAAGLPDAVDPDTARDRIRRLVELTQSVASERRGRHVGRTLEVLVEGPSRDGSCLRGRTPHNVTVNLSGAADAGDFVPAKITGATSTTLSGHIVRP
jgi:tRNA-2-methylthio-N6-dimethylallyladenosine synthase